MQPSPSPWVQHGSHWQDVAPHCDQHTMRSNGYAFGAATGWAEPQSACTKCQSDTCPVIMAGVKASPTAAGNAARHQLCRLRLNAVDPSCQLVCCPLLGISAGRGCRLTVLGWRLWMCHPATVQAGGGADAARAEECISVRVEPADCCNACAQCCGSSGAHTTAQTCCGAMLLHAPQRHSCHEYQVFMNCPPFQACACCKAVTPDIRRCSCMRRRRTSCSSYAAMHMVSMLQQGSLASLGLWAAVGQYQGSDMSVCV